MFQVASETLPSETSLYMINQFTHYHVARFDFNSMTLPPNVIWHLQNTETKDYYMKILFGGGSFNPE